VKHFKQKNKLIWYFTKKTSKTEWILSIPNLKKKKKSGRYSNYSALNNNIHKNNVLDFTHYKIVYCSQGNIILHLLEVILPAALTNSGHRAYVTKGSFRLRKKSFRHMHIVCMSVMLDWNTKQRVNFLVIQTGMHAVKGWQTVFSCITFSW
jgi:hypothetical protein